MEKLILVLYLNMNGVPNNEVDDYCKQVIEKIKNDDIIHYVIPVRNQETKVECINPKLVSEKGYEQAKIALESIVQQLTELNNK